MIKVRQPSVCVFIKGRHGVGHVLFDLKKNQIIPSSREDALDLLECPPGTKQDAVHVKLVEEAAIKAFEAWLELQGEEDKLFPNERVCVVYLQPEPSQEPNEALRQIVSDKNVRLT